MFFGRRLMPPYRCSTAATMRSRTFSPPIPAVVATKLMASRSQQSSAKAMQQAFAVIAGHLEALGTPTQVRLGNGDAAVVATLGPTGMTLEQRGRVDGVHALMVRGLATFDVEPT